MHAQPCPALCDPVDSSPPDSSVHGIFQARILEWVAISYCRASSQPRDQTRVSCISCIGRQDSLPLATSGKPTLKVIKYFKGTSLNSMFSTSYCSISLIPLQQLLLEHYLSSVSNSFPHTVSWTSVSQVFFFHFCPAKEPFLSFLKKLLSPTHDIWKIPWTEEPGGLQPKQLDTT